MKQVIYNDSIILIGYSAKDNWNLLSKSSQKDLLFHLSSFPSCYVVLKQEPNREPSKEIIKECAQLCLQHTKYKSMKGILVDYTPVNNVTKGSNIGEIIYKNRKKVLQIKI